MSKAWFGLLGIGLLIGIFTALSVIFRGLGVYNLNDVTFWAMPMAGYLFFALTAAGLTLLSSLPSLFGLKEFYPFAKRAALLAFATLLVGIMCKGLDLGPLSTLLNTVWVGLSPNPTSPIWWMAVLYGIYLTFVIIKFYFINKGEWHTTGSWTAGLLALGLMIMAYTALSIVFGTADARPAFFGHFSALYFAVTALTSGMAAIVLASFVQSAIGKGMSHQEEQAFDKVAKMFAVMLAVALFVFILRAIIGYTSLQMEFQGFRYIAGTGIYQMELWLGLVIPLVLMLIPGVRRTAAGKMIASVLALVGMFAGRLVMLLSAQIMPIGAMAETRPEIVTYAPSFYEWGTIILALSLSLMIYSLGVKYLNLEATPEH